MKLRKKHKEQTELHTGPLNDILFILLFFFLLASLFSTLNALKVNLPSGKSDTKVAQRFVVTIDSLGKIEFQNKNVTLNELSNLIYAKYQEDTTVKHIVFNGDRSSRYGDFVDVMNMAKDLKMKVSVNITEE